MSATMLLEFDVLLDAPAARVFAAVTEGRHLTQWFCDACESEPHRGGRLLMRWTKPGASVEEFVALWQRIEPRIAASFQGGHAGYPDGNAGEIEFALIPAADRTHLWVRHRMPDTPPYLPIAERYRAAWPRALARLQKYLTPTTEREIA